MSNFSRGDARGSKILLIDKDGAPRYPGRHDSPNAATPSFPMTIKAEMTHNANISLIRNGEPIRQTRAKTAAWEITENGVYRVEARRGGGAWIYSNPFPVGGYPL
jgi:hypothetical protein